MTAQSLTAEFRPLPLLGNPHVQTLLGNLLGARPLATPAAIRYLSLPDGDQLVLHDSLPASWTPGGKIALLVHGLTGSHSSGYLLRLAAFLLRREVRVVRLDLRGAGLGLRLARKPYHAGCSEDVRAAVTELERWSPKSPLFLAGFSLGGNIVLKLAGEAGDRPVSNLRAVAAVNPPVDLHRCSQLLAERRNRFYELHFVRQLVNIARRRQRLYPSEPRVRLPRPWCLTLRQFDDLYTAPCCGFAGADDYYARSSALPYIGRTPVPALVLTARDDPFIAVEPIEELRGMPNLEVRIADRGGHLGYLGWGGARSVRWAERQIADWVTSM